MEGHRISFLRVKLKDTGIWHIDKQFGKYLCVVELHLPVLNIRLHDTPTHNFCEEFLDKMLEAEWRNDNFVFMNGKYGSNSKRPPQLKKKINEIETILNKWREKN
jgi:hypothetical protein